MRNLTLKLTLAFLLVSLTGVGLAALFIQQRTHSEFDRFLFARDRGELTNALTEHYSASGSWEGVEDIFLQMSAWKEDPGWERHPADRSPFTLAGADGMIIYGTPHQVGRQITEQEINNGIPLEVDGEEIGWLLLGPYPAARMPKAPEGAFLESINRLVLISALIAVAIALLLGSILARTITRPVRELTNATQVVAQGDLGYQVEVRSKDELGRLAASFNQMSADLARSNRLRRQMTADIAHDLRTPLSLILGYTEALSEGKLEASGEIFSVMHNEAGHLSHLVDDLHTISLADARELPLNLQNISPASLLKRTAAAFNPQAEQKSIALQVDADPGLPRIKVDPERMAQVLGNLVSNALRYTPEGGRIELSATSDDRHTHLQVRDNGSGIVPEDLPYIFTRFYRGDRSRQQNGAAGLGLTITRSLVEAQGGSIAVESEPGQGTTFTILLPR